MAGSLAWPPTKEDLERLYLVEKLSAAKIAKEYGLKYKTPKVAESVVLYQLKKNGIQRRSSTEHVEKVTSEMVDEWAKRYAGGESLKQIAGDKVSPATVFLHLRKRGVKLRDKVEAQIKAVTKYERKPFAGDAIEMAYLVGLRYGDLNVVMHGRAIRVRVSTSRPAMANLFGSLFSPYGHVSRYPREAGLMGFEWNLECDLDSSFRFLLARPSIQELENLSPSATTAFLAGFFDAEGSIYLHKKRDRYNPEVTFSNTEEKVLQYVSRCLTHLGIFSKLEWQEQPTERSGVTGPSRLGHLYVWRFDDIQRLLRVLPIKHVDRIRKSQLVLQMEYRASQTDNMELVLEWTKLSKEIVELRDAFVASARNAATSSAER